MLNRTVGRIIAVALGSTMMMGCASSEGIATTDVRDENAVEAVAEESSEPKAITIDKCDMGNPIVGSPNELIYGGDPSVLVDGDTVYLYTGHDASTDEQVSKSIYAIPEYFCYSSSDMINWSKEGVVMSMDTVKWAKDADSAWASQVAKHYDEETGSDKYYLYYCSWDKSGKQSIGVAVSDSPTGQFVDIGEPLVKGSITKPATSSFNDIDPTIWIETDDNGEEHRYLAWGNGILYICELNDDMISVTDVNGDGKITCGMSYGEDDIVTRTKGIDSYTEAPWLYRRQDENGNYYGKYYLIFAHKWRECMAYVTTDDLMNGEWSDITIIMNPTTTSNTTHMGVCEFNGKSYLVYHNGSLPKGNGYRRSACVREICFDADGNIGLMEETSAGVSGFTNKITTMEGALLGHEKVINSISDADYPYVEIKLGENISEEAADSEWVLRPGKADTDEDTYVSIESENKSGLYVTMRKDGSVVLMQDTVASEDMYKKQTFKTVEGLADKEGVSFESVFYEGEYLTMVDGILSRGDGSDAEKATFYIK